MRVAVYLVVYLMDVVLLLTVLVLDGTYEVVMSVFVSDLSSNCVDVLVVGFRVVYSVYTVLVMVTVLVLASTELKSPAKNKETNKIP